MRKDKVRFGAVVFMVLFVGLLVAGLFYLSYGIEQNFSQLKEKKTGIQEEDIKFTDATWHLVDFPGCENAYDENRAMQEIGLIYTIPYYASDYNCNLQITTYYDDGKVSTPQSKRLDETIHTFSGFNVFDSYKFTICCTDNFETACKSKMVKSYC